MQYLTSEQEDSTSRKVQESPPLISSFLILKDSFVLDSKSSQISGFKYCHPINKVFTDTFNDSCLYSLVDLTKPPKFDEPPFESLGNF